MTTFTFDNGTVIIIDGATCSINGREVSVGEARDAYRRLKREGRTPVQEGKRTITCPKSGRSLETEWTNVQALQLLPEDNDFAQSLKSKAPNLSASQWFWVHKLAQEAQTEDDTVIELDEEPFNQLVNLFTSARTNLLRPCIRFETPAGTIRVDWYQGAYAIRCGWKNIARIEDRKLKLFRTCSEHQAKIITLFAANPVAMAVLWGKNTNRCCFCARELSTPESVSAGYGPICADNWGLPWGHVSEDVANFKIHCGEVVE